jgi:hypothetical protein
MYISLKSWTICLTVWITDARCTVLKVMHLSGCAWIETTSVTIAAQRFLGYKYHFHLALIIISHHIFLSCLGFTSLALYLQTIEDKRGTKRAPSLSKEGSPSPSSAKSPPLAPSGSPPPLGSLPEISSHRPCSPVFEQGALREGSSGGSFFIFGSGRSHY